MTSTPGLAALVVRLGFGLAAFWPLAAGAARAPDWLTAIIAEDVSALSQRKIAVRLLDSADVRHLPDNRVKRVNRGAVRLLTEPGRSFMACAYSFNGDTERVLAARAWIVSGDGKKVDAYTLKDFIDSAVRVGGIFWPQQRLLSYVAPPTTALGSVFAWEFEVESQSSISDLDWVFPTTLPIHLAQLDVTPSPGGKLIWRGGDETLPLPTPGPTVGALHWERRDFVVPGTNASDRPTGFLAAHRGISVRNVAPNSPASVETWSDLARIATDVIESRLKLDPETRAKAEALVAGKTGRWEKARALTEFVQRDITYLAVILDKDYLAGYRPHAPGEVMKNRYGDCKDKSALLVAMLRAIGDEGHVVLVTSGNPKAVRPDWPSAQFNHAIAAIPADDAVPAGWPVVNAGALGRLVLFDATDSKTPLGVLSASDQGGFGLVASARSTELIPLPTASAQANRIDIRIDARLDATGTLAASVRETAIGGLGVAAHATRENLRNDRFTPVLEKRLRESISFLEALQWKDTWDPGAAKWNLEYEFKAPRYARRTGGDLMLISLPNLLAKTSLAAWRTRQEGVVWRPAATRTTRVRLTLPEGATVEELPDGAKHQNGYMSGVLRYAREGQDLVFEYTFTEKGGFLDQRSYEAFRATLRRFQDSEKRPVLIRLGVPAAAAASK